MEYLAGVIVFAGYTSEVCGLPQINLTAILGESVSFPVPLPRICHNYVLYDPNDVAVLDVNRYGNNLQNWASARAELSESAIQLDFTIKVVQRHDLGQYRFSSATNQTKQNCERIFRLRETHKDAVADADGGCVPSVDDKGNLWNISQPGKVQNMACPRGYTGTVSRYCNTDAIYESVVYQCTSQEISRISYKMDAILYSSWSANLSLTNTLYELSNATDGALMNGDIETILKTLTTATIIVKDRVIQEENKPEAFFDVTSNLLNDLNSGTWESIIYKEGTGAEKVIEVIDNYISAIVSLDPDSFTEPQEFVEDNLLLYVGSMSGCSKVMDFPGKSLASMPDWVINSDDKVQIQCSAAGQSRHFSAVFYKNVTHWIPFRTFEERLKNDTVNSALVSVSMFPDAPMKLNNPIELAFSVVHTNMKDPNCSYWKTDANMSRGHGSWATDGCQLKTYDNDIVVCLCDHLTNFAILMSHADPEEDSEADVAALSKISLAGCIISMFCLLTTVAAYIICWGAIKSERSMILLHLCVALLVAYLLFLAGVNRTENKTVCTAVAVSLHFVYLTVFLLMLVQGIIFAVTVLKPLRKQRFGWQMTVAAYGAGALIVACSMGATQLHGYGNEHFCWLSVESGLLWAFLVPVLVVIVVNAVIVVIVLRAMFGTAAVKKKTDKDKLRTRIRSICILMPVMGITWIFGVFSMNKETVVFQYLFAIFNSVQGILIFVFHCLLNTKIQDALKKSRAARLLTADTVTLNSEKVATKSMLTAKSTQE